MTLALWLQIIARIFTGWWNAFGPLWLLALLAAPIFILLLAMTGIGIWIASLFTVSWPDPPVDPVTCPANRVIVRIYGTGSTGDFKDAAQPPTNILGAERNTDYNDLLGAFRNCAPLTLVTFSYDIGSSNYLPDQPGQPPVIGVNAWNDPTSPWNLPTDEIARRLQGFLEAELARAGPNTRFDLIGYSAGAIVPVYWAARPETTDDWRRRIHSIITVDGVVSGVSEVTVASCEGQLWPIRDFAWQTFGRLPCHFASDSRFLKTVNDPSPAPSPGRAWWNRVPLVTVKTDGDAVVWYDIAGIAPSSGGPKTATEPPTPIHLPGCFGGDGLNCMNPISTHGYVLHNGTAIELIKAVILNDTLQAPTHP